MTFSLSAGQKDILSIFKIEAQYVIPPYQRPYSWEYDECLQLYTDIMEAFENNEDYFIGNIVIAKSESDKEKLEVIDGQQRLTTLLLFIKILSLFAPEQKILSECLIKTNWEGTDEEPRIKSQIFEAIDGEQLKEVLSLTIDEFKEYACSLKDAKGNFIVSKVKNFFLRNGFFFYTWIESFKKNNGDLKEFIRYLLQRVYLLPIELNGKTFEEAGERALRIFETLNNRGRSLDDADIFKAKLYNDAKNKGEESRFLEMWVDLKSNCDALNLKIDDVFRYYSHVIRGKEEKTSLEMNIRDFFIKETYSPFHLKSYDEIMDDLANIVRAVEYINDEKIKPTELAKWLQLIEVYTNQFPRFALVVYVYLNLHSKNFDLISFAKKLVRLAYYAGSTSTIKFAIFNVIRDVSLNKNIDDFLKSEINETYFDYLGALKSGYALLAFYLTQKTAMTKYTIDKLVSYKDSRVLKTWEKNQIEEVSVSLGNFVVLDIEKENNTIDKKALTYAKSNIDEIKKLSLKLNHFTYDDFKERDSEKKLMLVDFFKGVI